MVYNVTELEGLAGLSLAQDNINPPPQNIVNQQVEVLLFDE